MSDETNNQRHGVYVRLPQGLQDKLNAKAKADGFSDGAQLLAYLVGGAAFGPVSLDLRDPRKDARQPELSLTEGGNSDV